MGDQSLCGLVFPSTSGGNVQMDEGTDDEIDVLNCTDDQLCEGINHPLIPYYIKSFVPDFNIRFNQLSTLKYPACVEASLTLIVDIIRLDYRRGIQSFDLQIYLINEFIFGKVEKLYQRNYPRSYVEFQLMNTLLNFLMKLIEVPEIRNNIILTIFPCDASRFDYFGNFICYCINLSRPEILDAAGLWLQQAGLSSQCCKELAMHVVNYFLKESLDTMPKFIATSISAPHFISNLLTVLTNVFNDSNPSNEILQLVDTWINTNPNMLTISLSYNPRLPPGAITMPSVLPIAGLLSWCVLHPTREEAHHINQRDFAACERFNLFGSIHHKALSAVASLKRNTFSQCVIAAKDLEEIIEKLVERLRAPLANVSKASYIFASGRLFEVIQSTTTANCIYGNKQRLHQLLGILGAVHYCYIKS